ncbi:8150_t:CDS:2, partial [Funneliformis caledonium]
MDLQISSNHKCPNRRPEKDFVYRKFEARDKDNFEFVELNSFWNVEADFDKDFYYGLCIRCYQDAIDFDKETIKETIIEEISSDESEELDDLIEIPLLKLNEEGYRSTVGVSIKLHPEHETLSNALNFIRNKFYGIWKDKVQLCVELEDFKESATKTNTLKRSLMQDTNVKAVTKETSKQFKKAEQMSEIFDDRKKRSEILSHLRNAYCTGSWASLNCIPGSGYYPRPQL